MGTESYGLCAQFAGEGACRFGAQCVDAHSKEELKEWRDRLEYRLKRAQKAAKLVGKTFTDTVLDKLGKASSPENVSAAAFIWRRNRAFNALYSL